MHQGYIKERFNNSSFQDGMNISKEEIAVT